MCCCGRITHDLAAPRGGLAWPGWDPPGLPPTPAALTAPAPGLHQPLMIQRAASLGPELPSTTTLLSSDPAAATSGGGAREGEPAGGGEEDLWRRYAGGEPGSHPPAPSGVQCSLARCGLRGA